MFKTYTAIQQSACPPRDPRQTSCASLVRLLRSSSPASPSPPTATHFPLAGVHAGPRDWPPGRPLSPTAPTLETIRGPPSEITLRGPEVLHYWPRGLWMSRVVNHCQLHISVCLGAARSRALSFFFSQSLWEITSKCWQISKFTAPLQRLSRWLIIQSRCFTPKRPEGGGAPSLYLADIKQQSGGLAVNFAAATQPERKTDAAYRSDSPSLCTVFFFFLPRRNKVASGTFWAQPIIFYYRNRSVAMRNMYVMLTINLQSTIIWLLVPPFTAATSHSYGFVLHAGRFSWCSNPQTASPQCSESRFLFWKKNNISTKWHLAHETR